MKIVKTISSEYIQPQKIKKVYNKIVQSFSESCSDKFELYKDAAKEILFRAENYVKPLQKEFSTYRTAQLYARSRIVEALRIPEPYEHMVLMNTKTYKILDEFRGNADSVSTDFWGSFKWRNNASVIHGHPDTLAENGQVLSPPVSFTDFLSINKSGFEIIAYNKNGEYSMLRKKQDFQPLDAFRVKELRIKFIKAVSQKAEAETKAEIEKALSFFEKPSLDRTEDEKTFLKKMNKKILELQNTFDGIHCIHNFWKEHANEMGFIYQTNYSSFR